MPRRLQTPSLLTKQSSVSPSMSISPWWAIRTSYRSHRPRLFWSASRCSTRRNPVNWARPSSGGSCGGKWGRRTGRWRRCWPSTGGSMSTKCPPLPKARSTLIIKDLLRCSKTSLETMAGCSVGVRQVLFVWPVGSLISLQSVRNSNNQSSQSTNHLITQNFPLEYKRFLIIWLWWISWLEPFCLTKQWLGAPTRINFVIDDNKDFKDFNFLSNINSFGSLK